MCWDRSPARAPRERCEIASAAEIVQIAVNHRPDVLIVDLNMPGDAFKAIAEAAMAVPDMKIVVFTRSARSMPVPRIALPMPQTPPLRKLARDMIQKPALAHDLDGWAEQTGVSRSTFTRRFRGETGLSFAEWRRRLRMLHTLTLQANGVPLRQAAVTAGYRNANALRDMMRRTLTTTVLPPSQELSR